MTEQLHQGVDADVGASEFGGVGLTQSVHQGTRDGLGLGARAFESAFDAGLQGPLGDSLSVATDEEGGACRPTRETGSCCGPAPFGIGKAGRPGV